MPVWGGSEEVGGFVQTASAEVRSWILTTALFDHVHNGDSHGGCKVGEFGRVRLATHQQDGSAACVVGSGGTKQHAACTGQHVALRHGDELRASAIIPMATPSP